MYVSARHDTAYEAGSRTPQQTKPRQYWSLWVVNGRTSSAHLAAPHALLVTIELQERTRVLVQSIADPTRWNGLQNKRFRDRPMAVRRVSKDEASMALGSEEPLTLEVVWPFITAP